MLQAEPEALRQDACLPERLTVREPPKIADESLGLLIDP
jgi:hypothetical protein